MDKVKNEEYLFAHVANKRFTKKRSYAIFVNLVLWAGLLSRICSRIVTMKSVFTG